jgi:hypothetical protein
MRQGRPTSSGETWPARGSLAIPDHSNVVEDPPPPEPALVEVIRYLARRAARQWFEQQMRGGERDEE